MRNDLPIEAVSIDGQFIEDAISGYQTIKTSGRESLTPVMESYATGASDGETMKYANYPARVITVEFSLQGTSMPDMRDKLNHLNNLLSMEEADFVFNDEDDKFFTGMPMIQADSRDIKNGLIGSYQIYCPYPFKRSTAVFKVNPTTVNDHDAIFNINYGGNYPARPILRAKFAGRLEGGDHSDDGDCGYVAFMDDDGSVIQLGNPEALDFQAYSQAQQLINRTFSELTDWAQSGGKTWQDKAITGSLACENIADAYWNKGAGQTLKFAKPTYGSDATHWHGPILYKSTEGAVDFDLAIVHRMCVNNAAETGAFECGLYNVTGGVYKMVAGFVIEKTASGSTGKVRYIINGAEVGSDNIDLSYYNTNFGYCSRTQKYKTQWYNKKKKKWVDSKVKGAKTRQVANGYDYTQSNLNSSVKRSGETVTFKIGNLAARVFTCTDIGYVTSHVVSFHFGQQKGMTAMNTNAVNSVRFTANPMGTFADIPNVFTAGDVVEADCNDASVYIKHENTEEGHIEPQFGALGNDWEGFRLNKGANTVKAVWSDWVDTDYKPALEILYNEVYI